MGAPDDTRPWQVLNKRPLYRSQFEINVALWTVRLPDGTVAKGPPRLGSPSASGGGDPGRS